MEEFNTKEKVLELFAKGGCLGNENCCFIACKDSSRAESGLLGGMNYPYDGVLINKTENGIGMIFLRFIKPIFLKTDITNFAISGYPCEFIPNSEIRQIKVKNASIVRKNSKSLIIKTGNKKHCLVVNLDEPLLPYHNADFAQFMSQYAK